LPNPEDHRLDGATGSNASIWALKPWWCQPWSILLTGLTIIVASWWLLRLWWITLAVGLAIGLWWSLFLVLMPAAWKDSQPEGLAIEERSRE
jgi:hypothetical protein